MVTEQSEPAAAARAQVELQALLNAAVDAIIVIDADGRIETFNPGAELLFGYRSDQVVGRDVSVLMPAGDRDRHGGYMSDYEHTRRRRIIGIGRDVMAARADGSQFPVFLSVGEIAGGTRPRYVGIIHDMTARRAALEALRAERDRVERYLDVAEVLLIALDLEHRIELINRRGLQILGYEEQELIGRDYFDTAVPPALRDSLRANFDRLLALGDRDAISAESPVLTKQGQVRTLGWRARTVRDANGIAVGFLASGEDITERRRAEQRLRKSESLLRAAQEIANLGNFEVQLRDGSVQWSEQACRMAGFALGHEPRTMAEYCQRVVHPDDRERFAHEWTATAESGQRFELLHRVVRPDGSVRDLQGIAQPLSQTSDGATVLGTLYDLTERRAAEDEIRQSQDKLTHFARLSTMGEMATGLAHEINQPLTAIATYAQAALRFLDAGTTDPADLHDALTQITQQSLRAGEVIRRLRTFVKNRETRAETVDLNRLVADVHVLAETDARVNDLRLVLDLAPAPIPSVAADPVQIQQVLLNLVRNAIDATMECPEAPREVVVRTRVEGSEIEVSVVDHAHGIPADVAAQLFNPFFTTKPAGTGLGLAISRSIIRAHQGRLGHRPSDGSGTTFYFTLPCSIGA